VINHREISALPKSSSLRSCRRFWNVNARRRYRAEESRRRRASGKDDSSCIYFYNRRAHRSRVRRRIDWPSPGVRSLFFVWGYEFLTTSPAVDSVADRYNCRRIRKCARDDRYRRVKQSTRRSLDSPAIRRRNEGQHFFRCRYVSRQKIRKIFVKYFSRARPEN